LNNIIKEDEQMEISIIVPVHNLEDYITECLESISMQNYDKAKYEIILVLDSCTDGSKQKVQEWKALWPEITTKVLEVSFGNPGETRNAGIEAAEGEKIAFIDGDDYWVRADALSTMDTASQGGLAVYQENYESNEGITAEAKERDAVWRFFIPKELIGETRFASMKTNEDFRFIRELKKKVGVYTENRISETLYHYTHPRTGSITTEM